VIAEAAVMGKGNVAASVDEAVLSAAVSGLCVRAGRQKTLPPWLFYDERGSQLFEQITALPEYYLTRAERAIFAEHAAELAAMDGPVTIAELGAGSASKTGVLLRAVAATQPELLYQPIDISPTALDEAAASITAQIPGVRVAAQVANYTTEPYAIERPAAHRVLALYIGSSIANFSPREATSILRSLREQLTTGDALLLGVDLAPGAHKPVADLLAAYDDAAGMSAAFNKNALVRLNRELGADFDLERFAHQARWNAACSRMEMHLESLCAQTVEIAAAGVQVAFAEGETIHTENSYKFTEAGVEALLASAEFGVDRVWRDEDGRFAAVLAGVR
jgi:L-histidine N-alpha-methyltransferase